MKTIAIAAIVLGLAATATTPSFAAPRHHTDQASQYESLVQRDASPAVFEQGQHQGRTINAWGHTFTVE